MIDYIYGILLIIILSVASLLTSCRSMEKSCFKYDSTGQVIEATYMYTDGFIGWSEAPNKTLLELNMQGIGL